MFTQQDKQLIKDLGLQKLSEEQQIAQLGEFYETLDIRVGMALEDHLTGDQIKEFETINQAGDDAATEAWLRGSLSDYDLVLAKELAALKGEIQETARQFKQIIAATRPLGH